MTIAEGLIDFEKIKFKIMCLVTEYTDRHGYRFYPPHRLEIKIPLDGFDSHELAFLVNNEHIFSYIDEGPYGTKNYPCYKIDEGYLLTNEINLSALFFGPYN